MKTLIASLILFSFVSVANAGERQTTWRPGDMIGAVALCVVVDPLIKAATHLSENKSDLAQAVWVSAFENDQCRGFPQPIQIMLVEYVVGPFETQEGVGSVWSAVDINGTIVYLLLDDNTGGHPAIKLQKA